MPRCFFDTDDGERRFRDEVGIELPDIDAVAAEAFGLLRDLAHGKMPEGRLVMTTDVRGDDGFHRDAFGDEFAGLEEARAQCRSLLPDVARSELPDGDRHDISCEVEDEMGQVAYRGELNFRGTLFRDDHRPGCGFRLRGKRRAGWRHAPGSGRSKSVSDRVRSSGGIDARRREPRG